jgi:hypothetical protein
MRKVEIKRAGEPSTEPDCDAGSTVPCGPRFARAHPKAKTLVENAKSAFADADADATKKAWIDNAVSTLFGDVIHYGTVRGHVTTVLSQVNDQPANHECHNTCDGGCQTADAYMPPGSGLGLLLTLCPSFEQKSDTAAAETLVHEAFHVTPGLESEDLAYAAERGILYTDSATALKNTDSYVLLVKELNTRGSVVSAAGMGTRDVIDPSIAGAERAKLGRVMAYLEKWVIESTAETSGLYDTIKEARDKTPPTWTGVEYPYYTDTMKDIVAPLFGLRMPPLPPRERDQVAVAGIYHRLMKMDDLLWGTDIEIKKIDPGDTHFGPGPSEPLHVNPATLASSRPDMLNVLLVKLVDATTEIRSAHKPKYVQLIKEIRVHAGHPDPV